MNIHVVAPLPTFIKKKKGISSEIKDICKPAPFGFLGFWKAACIFIGCQDFLVDFAPPPFKKRSYVPGIKV